METKRKTCFVIMPFHDPDDTDGKKTSGKWDGIFEFIKRCVEQASEDRFVVSRSKASTGSITHDIYENLMEADLVIADCTNKNANVFYELGIRHSVRAGTILIAQSMQDIPFDIIHLARHQYDMNQEKLFINNLKDIFEQIEEKPRRPDSEIGNMLKIKGLRFMDERINIEFDGGKYKGVVFSDSAGKSHFTFHDLILKNMDGDNSIVEVFCEIENPLEGFTDLSIFSHKNGEMISIPFEIKHGDTTKYTISLKFDHMKQPPHNINSFSLIFEDTFERQYKVQVFVDNPERSVYPIREIKHEYCL